MRLSFWHCELAKRIATGQTNRDIMKEIQVSGSRLSVLKANPVFAAQVEKYRRVEEDKYNKAIEVFENEAEDVAKEIVKIAKDPVHSKTKLDAGLAVLDKLGQAKGKGESEGEELVFEQMLRVTRKSTGKVDGVDNLAPPIDEQAGLKELEQDAETGVWGIEQAG